MPAAQQGINKITVYKKQTAFGSTASGSGGQILRRRTSVFQAPRDTFENDEIVSHHQSTGISFGLKHASARIEGLLSPGTFSPFFGTMLERVFTAGVSAAGVSVTIAGTGPTFTVTRGSGSFLTDGFKVGMIIRLSVGTLNALNINRNLWIVGLTATVATVRVIDQGSALVAEGPIAGTTISAPGKYTYAPLTGHVDEYYTFEEWFKDLSRSEVYPDMKPSTIALTLPPTGNSTFGMDLVGLQRIRSGVQSLTTPTSEGTAGVLSVVHGGVLVNGVVQDVLTGLTINLANGAADQGAVIGANTSPGVQKGRIRVTGQFTALFNSDAIQTLYDAETPIGIQVVVSNAYTAAADFVALCMSRVKITNDAPDDGEKAVTRTYPFTAELDSSGGAGAATEATILSIQDSLA